MGLKKEPVLKPQRQPQRQRQPQPQREREPEREEGPEQSQGFPRHVREAESESLGLA